MAATTNASIQPAPPRRQGVRMDAHDWENVRALVNETKCTEATALRHYIGALGNPDDAFERIRNERRRRRRWDFW